MWVLWHFGNIAQSIKSFKRFVKNDMSNLAMKTTLAKTRIVMESIHASAKFELLQMFE